MTPDAKIFSNNLINYMRMYDVQVKDICFMTGRNERTVKSWMEGTYIPCDVNDIVGICRAINCSDVVKLMCVDAPKVEYDLDDLIKDVASIVRMSPTRMRLKRRNSDLVYARHLTWYLSREIFGYKYSYKLLGHKFSASDHATVIHGKDRIRRDLRNLNQSVMNDIDAFIKLRPEVAKKARMKPYSSSSSEDNSVSASNSVSV